MPKGKPPRATLTIRPRDNIKAKLDSLCESRGNCSVNYLIERLIDEEYGRKFDASGGGLTGKNDNSDGAELKQLRRTANE